MKRILSLSFVVIVLFSFASCSNKNNSNAEQKEIITLNEKNFEDYINIDFDFEELDVQTEVSNNTTHYHVNVVCNIQFSAKNDTYEFKDTEIAFAIKSSNWEVSGEKLSSASDNALAMIKGTKYFSISNEGEAEITVLFYKKTTNASSLHPLNDKDWSYQIKSIKNNDI